MPLMGIINKHKSFILGIYWRSSMTDFFDKNNYSVVQTGPDSWAVQYMNGPIIRGMDTKDEAIEYAALSAMTGNNDTRVDDSPRTLEEATESYTTSQNELRLYLSQNPAATEDDLQPFYEKITQANNYVSNFIVQNEVARTSSNDQFDYDTLAYEQQLEYADRIRQQRLDESITARNSGDTNSIILADTKAFEAEVYYQELLKSYPDDVSVPTSLLGDVFNDISGNLLSTVSNSFNSIVGNVLSIVDGLGNTPSSLDNSNATGVYRTNTGMTSSNEYSGTNTSDNRIRISPKPALREKIFSGVLEPLSKTGGVIFPFTPVINYKANASYQQLATVHSNQDYYIYQNTPSISVSIQGEFTAQNDEEAKYLLACIHFLRTMTKMRFGDSDENRGLPPPQLLLNGYGTFMFNNLSVILTDYDIQLPKDVDYYSVELGGGTTSVPVLTTITIQCIVQTTPNKQRTFNWDKFASGELLQNKGWL